ncbi:MAG TPA: hypothetical protein VFE62_20945 [Gemmataceae bacterium]|nr:hypothetical protein [Gemmataceae bacterium]
MKAPESTKSLPEKLAAELVRVTELRERCRWRRFVFLTDDTHISAKRQDELISAAIEQGIRAAGINDALEQMHAVMELEGFKE